MYDRHLDTFVAVTRLGSFNRAAEVLHLTPNAVIKHINCLERDLGVTLFRRSPKGVALTSAGEVVYQGALDIIARSRDVLQAARASEPRPLTKIRLATSAMRSIERIGTWWSEVGGRHPSLTLETVPVMDDGPVLLRRLGEDIDVLFAIEPLPDLLLRERCSARRVLASPACLAVPVGHRLAARASVSLRDLAGERVYLTARGNTAQVERMRDDIARMGLHMDVVDCSPYDVRVFNQAAGERALVLNCMELGRVHPAYVNVPLEGGYDFPLCLVHSDDAIPAVREFVDAMAACAQAEGLVEGA